MTKLLSIRLYALTIVVALILGVNFVFPVYATHSDDMFGMYFDKIDYIPASTSGH